MNGHLNPLHGNTNRKINEKKLLKTDCGPLMEGHCTLMQVLVEQTEHVSVKRVCSCRFHYDDATAFHQLQVEVCCSFAMAHADLQGTQHVHWWSICIRHQDADPLQNWLLPRWLAAPCSILWNIYVKTRTSNAYSTDSNDTNYWCYHYKYNKSSPKSLGKSASLPTLENAISHCVC